MKTGKKSCVYSAGCWTVAYIWLYGHYLYFVEGEAECTYLYELKCYDLKKKRVITIDDGNSLLNDAEPLYDYMVVNKHVYEIRETNTEYVLYQMDLNGKHKKVLKKGNMKSLYKHGSKLLYTNDYGFVDSEGIWLNTVLYDLKGNKYKSNIMEYSNPIGLLEIPIQRGKYGYIIDNYNDEISLIKGYDDEKGNEYFVKKIKIKGCLDNWSIYGNYFVIQLHRFENNDRATYTYLVRISDMKKIEVV